MPIGIILYFVAFFSALVSAQDLWTSVRERSPLSATCAQFGAGSVSGDWLQLHECGVDYLSTVKIYKTGMINKQKEKDVVFYAPVRAAGVQDGPVALFIKVPAKMEPLLEQMFAADEADSKSGNVTATEHFLREHATEILVSSTTLSGLRESGMNSDSKVRNLLKSAKSFSVGPAWSILDLEREPAGVGVSLFMMAIALAYIAWRTRAWLRRGAAQARAEAQAKAEAESPDRIADLASQRQ